MTQRTTTTDQDLDWLLDGLVNQVAGARHAVVLSDDGLVVSRSDTLERDEAERLAAIATGQQSLAKGIDELFDGGAVRQVIVELTDLWVFITTAGRGTHLAVVASQDVDAELMSVAMHTLIQQVGRKLGTEHRTDGGGSDGGGRV
ncbi:roadblock/LC7 domain-containing protein [Streptomyces sp. TS71-3]|uniref:roadblock/LC7 domain-containing protein n=1 Tax=Streptomyces sp. TS71-3 TaxID=2733862 RepID=UPI001B098082|nr:roadblock/LC7 domain-containing protein [Streptomyces sp. TS71-3]GHJ35956.1 dynein regulation protein LC7 [Streptomyces sp. TS71-3]